jgi:sugar lactone lactonase YvrE
MSRLQPFVLGLGFAEAPRWREGQLWFVDYFQGGVFRADGDGNAERIATVPGTPGGLGFLPDSTPLVVSQRDFKLLRIGEDGSTSEYADLSAHARGAANELLVDGKGRAYVGHHGFDFFNKAPPQPSSLMLVEAGGSVRVVADGLTFPNGTALSEDGRTLVVAESFARRLTAFDVAEDGSLDNCRIFAEVGDHTPDGICMDAEGAIWLGSPMTGSFVRVREGGEVLDMIGLPDGRWGVACVLGGEDRRTLFCVSAATTPETMPKGESDAFIDTVQVDVPGAGLP